MFVFMSEAINSSIFNFDLVHFDFFNKIFMILYNFYKFISIYIAQELYPIAKVVFLGIFNFHTSFFIIPILRCCVSRMHYY